MGLILKILIMLLPWRLKRMLLIKCFHFNIDKSAYIGLAWIYPKMLNMGPYSKIGHFTVAIHLDLMCLKHKSSIGRSNWITGLSANGKSKHFAHQMNRRSELVIGKESAITKNHHIDCTNSVNIGNFVTLAGYQSQILTHSIDVYQNCQHSEPISIGDYCFIGTNVVILGGSILPSHSILGAKSLLNKSYEKAWTLYSGVPAKPIKEIDLNAKYFVREQGFVI